MKLVPVSLEGLSEIRHTISVAPSKKFQSAEFVMVAFSGIYQEGSLGADDAAYIAAVLAAVDRAWFWEALILDLSHLTYTWGDEMDWVYGAGRLSWCRCQRPLAIVVGDGCSEALQSLDPDSYRDHCVESFDEALELIRTLRPAYQRCLDESRSNE